MHERDYTTSTPATVQTNCNAYGSSVDCNTRSYGGGTSTNAVYTLYQAVTANGLTYQLKRTARWRWSPLDQLRDGDTFEAEIKGKSMHITCRKGGNQGKKETIKYEILDIR